MRKRISIYFNTDNPRDKVALENFMKAYNGSDLIKNLLAGIKVEPIVEVKQESREETKEIPNKVVSIEDQKKVTIDTNKLDDTLADIY